MTQQLIQAYRQAPWRVQLQRLGVLMAVLIVVALVAGVYLNISGQAATAGLEFQKMERTREALIRENADMKARLAAESSEANMQARAQKMGYKPVAMDKAVYVIVPGYIGRQPVSLAPVPGSDLGNPTLLKPAYTQSLWEWLFQGVLEAANNAGGVNP